MTLRKLLDPLFIPWLVISAWAWVTFWVLPNLMTHPPDTKLLSAEQARALVVESFDSRIQHICDDIERVAKQGHRGLLVRVSPRDDQDKVLKALSDLGYTISLDLHSDTARYRIEW